MKQTCRSGLHTWDTVAEANRCCSPSWRRAVRVADDPTLDGGTGDLDPLGRVYIPCGRATLVLGWVPAGIRRRAHRAGRN